MQSMRRRAGLLSSVALLVAALAATARAEEKDFKTLLAEGNYKALADKLEAALDVSKLDPKLAWYVKENIAYLRRGGKPRVKGSEIVLVRGVRKDHIYEAAPGAGGKEYMLPNTIRYQRMKWDPRLNRINKYFAEATKNKGGDPKALIELEKVLADHAGKSQRSVLISAATQPARAFGPPFYIIRVAPERAIFNYVSNFAGEREVLLPFWILPHEIVAKVETYEEVLKHPVYVESKLKELDMSSTGTGWGADKDVWKLIEENIRAGKKNVLEGVDALKPPAPAAPAAPAPVAATAPDPAKPAPDPAQPVLNSKFAEGRNVGPDATEAEVERFVEKVEKHGGTVEFLPENDPRLPADVQGRTTLGIDGRPLVLLPEGAVKKFALIDELTHVLQMERELATFGVESLTRLFDDAAKGMGSALDKLKGWEIQGKKMILSLLGQDDPARRTVERSVERLERAGSAGLTEAARLSRLRAAEGIEAPAPVGQRTGFAERLDIEARARERAFRR